MCLLLLVLSPALGQDAAAPARTVTAATLNTKIQEVEAATGLEEEAKRELLELYRKALANLQLAGSNAEAAKAFKHAAETAPAELQALRREMEKAEARPPETSLEIPGDVSLLELEQLLQKERADLAAVDARRSDFEQRLEEEARRPGVIRQRLTEARAEQEEVSSQLKLPPAADRGPATAEALRWVLEARFDALSSELIMLDQELLSHPMRLELLTTKRDKAANSVHWVGTRVRLLQNLVNERREAEAARAVAAAEEIRREAAGKHPLVERLAERNAALLETLAEMGNRQARLAEQVEQIGKLARRIETDFANARTSVEIGGLSPGLGKILERQRRAMPDRSTYLSAAKERAEEAARAGLLRLEHQEEKKQLLALDDYLGALLDDAAEPDQTQLRRDLRELAKDRRDLLSQVIIAETAYLRRLGDLEALQGQLLATLDEHNAFLGEHLLWVRGDSLMQLATSGLVSEQMGRILTPGGWAHVLGALVDQAGEGPLLPLCVMALVVLWAGRPRLRAQLLSLSDKVGKADSDSFFYSFRALVLSLVAAAPWPLALALVGWQLKIADRATDFTAAVASTLLLASLHLFYLRAFRWICLSGGLAAAHFRWPEANLARLRGQLDLLTWVFFPTISIALLAARLDPLDVGGVIGRLAFMIASIALALSLYHLLHPSRGVLTEYLRRPDRHTAKRVYRLVYPSMVAYPLAMLVLALWGYPYTAGVFIGLFLDTAWFALELLLIFELAQRWLLVTRRRLVYEAALERREALAESKQSEERSGAGEEGSLFETEEPEVDLLSLSDRSRKLLNTAILLYGLFGLRMIWSDVVPALGILDQVVLWRQSALVDGEPQLQAITLASLGLALLYLLITIVLAKQLPAVLEIALLHYFDSDTGTRYTVTTLTNYAIITFGLVLVFKTIGADWSQLQWLVAALGVGIGFGLQEIVANFISGIIILFERPVRIGDVITVGDTDGVVTRIRSRATTIRNWDGKELLVPNKEFITGRLLNWSLSDQTTRIIVSVGIAYGSNVPRAMQLLEEAARENDTVLEEPPPSVIFESFGDNSLVMLLRCFVDSADLRFPAISALNQAINDKFNAAGIVIAFPQRDLHLDTSRPLHVELRQSREE